MDGQASKVMSHLAESLFRIGFLEHKVASSGKYDKFFLLRKNDVIFLICCEYKKAARGYSLSVRISTDELYELLMKLKNNFSQKTFSESWGAEESCYFGISKGLYPILSKLYGEGIVPRRHGVAEFKDNLEEIDYIVDVLITDLINEFSSVRDVFDALMLVNPRLGDPVILTIKACALGWLSGLNKSDIVEQVSEKFEGRDLPGLSVNKHELCRMALDFIDT